MIPNATLRVVETHGVEANGAVVSGSFGLSLKNASSIMTILRDTLYSDKILAVLREYSANAWDSHRQSGKPDEPIKITLPTTMDPTLYIRDFGAGLSPSDIFTVFTQYGASTKRTDDLSVGMLGIGSKSGFAYSDSFTVTSWNGGMKRTYVAVLDKTEEGLINMLHEEPCGEETGVLIQIAVRPEDINEFTQKAKSLFRYFKPLPIINVELPALTEAQMALKEGVIYKDHYSQSGWVAIMGCVPYHIDLDELRGFGNPEGGVAEFLNNISGALYFHIGDVQVIANREELKYVPETKTALMAKFNLLVEEYVTNTLRDIEKGNFTPWQRRVKAQVLNDLLLPVPEGSKELVAGTVSLKDAVPKNLFIYQNKVASTSINIEENTRFVLRDDKRPPRGFRLGSNCYLVRPLGKVSWPDVQTELNTMIDKLGLTGITVSKLSDIQWYPSSRGGNGFKSFNIKHRQKVFKLLHANRHRPLSKNWEADDRVPTKDDVFVIIEGFNSPDFDLFTFYQEDMKMLKAFGLSMPTIYGYKSTIKHPVDMKDCLGTEYQAWRKGLAKSILTPDIEKILSDYEWANTSANYNWRINDKKIFEKLVKKIFEKLVKELGPTHQIPLLFERHLAGKKALAASKIDEQQIAILIDRLKSHLGKSEAKLALAEIYAKYEMFSLPNSNMSDMWGENSEKWIKYIKLVDSAP